MPFIVAAELALPEVDFASKTNESRASSAATRTRQKQNGELFPRRLCDSSAAGRPRYFPALRGRSGRLQINFITPPAGLRPRRQNVILSNIPTAYSTVFI